MLKHVHATLLLLALWLPIHVAAGQADSSSRTALVSKLITTLASELATGNPPFGDERAGTTAWASWDIQASEAAGKAAEVALQNALLKATGARLRVPTDTLWTIMVIQHVEMLGDTAVVRVDRGTRWCSRVNGQGASGFTYRYSFRRVKQQWQFVGSKPDIAYDPPPAMPDRGPYRCGV